jgi:hypothetical protein
MLIGSALHTLELGNCHHRFQGMFEQLIVNDANVRLRRLWLSNRVLSSAVVPMKRYLAQTTTLRDLRIMWLLPHQDLQALVPAFRANSCLVRVRILDRDENTVPLSLRSFHAQIRPFCLRNAKLTMLLRAYESGNNDAGTDSATGTLPIALAPALFAVAQQTPRTTVSIIVTGLLALSDFRSNVHSNTADASLMQENKDLQ